MDKTAALPEQKLEALSKDKTELLKRLIEREAHQARTIRPYARGANRADAQLPASWAQQRLWFIDQLEGGTAAYNIPVGLRMHGRLGRAALQDALDTLVHRHEVLRTVFVNSGGEPNQRIAAHGHFELKEFDLSGLEEEQREIQLRFHKIEEAQGKFDLSSGPLIRGRLLRLQTEEHVLLVTMHHIVSDGWSIGVFFRELTEFYGAYREGRRNPVNPLPIQYADYAQWQRHWLKEEILDRQLTYWRTRLEGAPVQLELPADRPRPAFKSYRGDYLEVVLNRQLCTKLRAFAQLHESTLFMVLCAGWAILLSRLSGQEDIVIGTPVANRRRPEFERLIGLFVNTLALRVEVPGNQPMQEFLKRIQEVTLEAYEHQDVPFERVVEALQPQRTLSRHPIFQAMFTLQSVSTSASIWPGLSTTLEKGADEPSKFDLELLLEDRGDEIVGTAIYATELFDRETVRRWLTSFTVLLTAMVQKENMCIGDLPILHESERAQVVDLFNATTAPYPQEKLIHELFEEQVERSSNAVAVEHEGRSLTYAELNALANQLARYLQDKGVGANQLVGLCLHRSLEMVVGLLGILKAGGAYVPLDPDYPANRLAHMLNDAAPKVLLTQMELLESLRDATTDVVALDRDWPLIARHASENLSAGAHVLRSHHLAYVIYTSGSTGEPKGVMVEHRNVVKLWCGLEAVYRRVASCNRIGINASFGFDASVKQFIQLLSGRAIVLIPQKYRWDASMLLAYIEENRIEGIDCTPSQLRVWLTAGLLSQTKQQLRLALIGGEAIDGELWRELARCSETEFCNVYGPTECTVDATAARLNGDTAEPHIGRPIENTRIYILDGRRHPVPIGVAGEIYIGGAGVGRGYLHRPDLTAQRFLSDPFSGEPHARMYKTGDLARWRTNGVIEYLGRNDQQVKIRGFRIELGEIEAQLTRHKQVKDAVVVAREDVPGEKRLVAYVTQRDRSDLAVEELRRHLKTVLPDYMVPSTFVTLEAFPLTQNGKLNRMALPVPELEAYARQPYEAPRGKREEVLARIWEELLRVERVGRQDNFFELGGHSLLLLQMKERLHQVGLSVTVRGLYESATLAELADALGGEDIQGFDVPPTLIPANCQLITSQMLPLVELQTAQIERIVQATPGGAANIQDIYPLAPPQEGILFHHLLDDRGGDTYVVALLLSVASQNRLEELIGALQCVIDRHDVLRTALMWEQLPHPVQVVYRKALLPVHELQPDGVRDPLEQLKERMRPDCQRLDIRRAPLMRLQTIAAADARHWYALLQLHHLVNDHESLEILVSEVNACFEGRAHTLPEPTPYRNHVAHALAYSRTHDSEVFFRSKLGDIEELAAPFGLLDVHADVARIEEAAQPLEPTLAQRIRTQARCSSVSPATLFHAAWGLVVAHTSGRDDVVFGTVLLGRLQGSTGGRYGLGLFVNTLPLRLRLRDLTAKRLVEVTQRELMELLNHEQASLATAQRSSNTSPTMPLFSTLLNYRYSSVNFDPEQSIAPDVTVLATQDRTNYPITLSVDDEGEGFTLSAQVDRSVDPFRITNYVYTAMQSLIAALESMPQTPVLTLSILPEKERYELLNSFNATGVAYPQDKLIHELVEAQTQRTPHAIAVIYEKQQLTYAELNSRANQFARYLLNLGVGPDKPVGICLGRTPEMVVGLLGILKAGGAYLPLDPNYPVERLQQMLEDAAPRVILTRQALRAMLPRTAAEVIELDTKLDDIDGYAKDDLPARQLGLTPQNLVYVIYTSGSTGRPKGTAMTHRSMVNLIEWHRQNLPLAEGSRVLQFAALSFDVAFQEIFSTLCAGGTLVLLDEWVRRDAGELTDFLNSHSIERLFVPPLMLQSLAEYSKTIGVFPARVRDIITAGEQLRISPEIVSFFRRLDECRLHNHYGPTETHVVTALTLSRNPAQWPAFPAIGHPISNIQIYVLNEQRQPVPIGVTGEIYIGGVGVARGYLHRPELTDERFLPDPFSASPQARMYKTGDLGRWRPDGVIEYLGRNDHQVKIRGFRVELGEIEAQLARHERVKEAVVIAREDVPGEKRLVAYVTCRDEGAASVEELRAYAKASLPEHMVPSGFVMLDQLPLTPSGKLDRRTLPAPELGAYVTRKYEPAQGELEQGLSRIWQELLGIEQVGRQDNFFELGGHSLLGMKMIVKISEQFGVPLSVVAVFQQPTIAQLAEILTSQLPAIASPANSEGVDSEEGVV